MTSNIIDKTEPSLDKTVTAFSNPVYTTHGEGEVPKTLNGSTCISMNPNSITLNTSITVNQEKTSSLPSKTSSSVYKGLLFAAASSIFFSLSSAIVKYVKHVHPAQLAMFRFTGIFVFNLPSLVYYRKNISPKGYRINLFFRGMFGATSLLLRFFAFRYLPIADASVIVFSIPVFVSLFAMCFLKEPCGLFHSISVATTFVGIVIITKFPLVIAYNYTYETEQMWGIFSALSSTFFGAGVYIFLRKLKEVHHSVIMFNFGSVAIIETLTVYLVMNSGWDWPEDRETWLFILVLAVFSYAGQLLLTLATKSENAGPVAVVRAAVDIILAYIWQIAFFNEHPDEWSISGAVIISSCIIVISLRKWLANQNEDHILRRHLKCLL